MSHLVMVLIAAAGTYLARLSFIAFGERLRVVPPRVELMLSMIPPAVLSAIAATSLLLTDDGFRGLDEWHIAAVISGAVAWKTKNVTLCILAGMAVVWTVGV